MTNEEIQAIQAEITQLKEQYKGMMAEYRQHFKEARRLSLEKKAMREKIVGLVAQKSAMVAKTE